MPRRGTLQLIFEGLVLPARARVLVLQAAEAAALLELRDLSAGGSVLAVAPGAAEYAALQKELGDRAGAEITVALEDLSRPPAGGPFDAALLDSDGPSGRGNAYVRQLIDWMARAVRPGGTLWLEGSGRRGIRTFKGYLEALATEVDQVALGGGRRAYRGTRRAELPPAEEADGPTVEVAVQGIGFSLRLQPGVFGGRKLDEATELLLEAVRLGPADEVLDLGCGAGAIGIAAALLAPQGRVVLADAVPAAVRLAEQNLAANGIGNAVAVLSDGYAALAGRRFDAILTNPPLHRHSEETRAVAERFIAEAPGHLRPGGRMWLVVSAFLPYERRMGEVFAAVETVVATPRFKVLMAC